MEIGVNEAIAERALAGESLTEAELGELDAVDVLSLGMLADDVRRARAGTTVVYARVLEWSGGPDQPVPAGGMKGVEIRIPGPAGTLAETLDLVAGARAALGDGVRVTGFWLDDLATAGWGPLPGTLGALAEAGLDAVAGAPVDGVAPEDLDALAAARLALVALTVRRETADRVGLMLAARRAVDGRPWITTFAPLPRQQSVTTPTTGYHDVRSVALARLALPGLSHIQVDWRQFGPKLAQVALTFGASRLDGVSPFDDPALGPRRASVEEVRRNIAAAGFEAADALATA